MSEATLQRRIGRKHITTTLVALLAGALVAFDPTPAHAVCGNNTLTPGDSTITLRQGRTNRNYLLHVPASYTGTQAVPLVIDLHGFTSNATSQKGVSGFTAISDREGFLLAHPNGRNNSWNAFGCCGTSLRNNVNDVAWLRSVVADIIQKGVVDQSRIYVTGLSNGGSMSHRLACEAEDIFASASPVSFTLNHPRNQCALARPITIGEFHGLNDQTVPYNGSGQFEGAQASAADWRALDQCTGAVATTTFSSTERCEEGTACAGGVRPSLCSLAGGHVLYNTQTTLNIADYAWTHYMKPFTLAGKPSTCN